MKKKTEKLIASQDVSDYRDLQTYELSLAEPSRNTTEKGASPDARRLAALGGTPNDRAQFLTEEVFIHTPDFRHATSTIERLLTRGTTFSNPGGMRIIADSGMGKDAIIRYFQRKFAPTWSEGNSHCPILYVTLPHRVGPGDIIRTFLRQLHTAFTTTQLVRPLEENLLEAMDECGTVGIFFNEAQHLVYTTKRTEREAARLAGESGDWLKGFLDKVRRPVFFFGIPGWDEVFNLDEQLGTRITHQYTFSAFNFDTTFIGVLRALDEAIPMPQPAGLDNKDLASALYHVTQGNWRLLIHLLREAIFIASYAGASQIEREDLSAAYQLNFGLQGNPFGPARAV